MPICVCVNEGGVFDALDNLRRSILVDYILWLLEDITVPLARVSEFVVCSCSLVACWARTTIAR